MLPRAQSSMPTLSIPMDILDEIAGHMKPRHLATLARVSKICNYSSNKVLYRHIGVGSPSNTVGCCKSLICGDTRSQSVRTFSWHDFKRYEFSKIILYRTLRHTSKLLEQNRIFACVLSSHSIGFSSDVCAYRVDTAYQFLPLRQLFSRHFFPTLTGTISRTICGSV